ncbi:MAG TPA: bifunctional 4-hydroxy-2-oxoglutarate aldolase/2-dehydro-3-deoxy-phosphogluconate aldolase [Balneolales bacterium]|nr:bifunctional 4-hydroxy-2-oxoglutarate aldolase/2-dehydro-3-deoxy-phosphogluconate aldolase [Balneolales bacterium]
MARFTRIQTATKMLETGMVPVFYNADLQTAKDVLKACYEGGVRVFEFTNRGEFAHEVFGELNKYAAREMPEMILGVGSVVDPGTCSLYIQLGANFIVSPVLKDEMARVCNARKIMWIPGCGSLTEINRAEEAGAEIVKIFPATQVGGPQFVAAVKGPCPWTSIMPTGGVAPTEENLKAWFDAGVACVGMGSKLLTREIISKKDFGGLKDKVAETLSLIASLKKS